MIEVKDVKKTGYGYELERPIRAFQAFESYAYFDNLKSKVGTIVKWERQGCIENPTTGHLVDMYYVFVTKTKNSNELLMYTLYIDMYYFMTDTKKPEDFE